MRSSMAVMLSVACLSASIRPAAAADTIPTVTLMLSSTGEFERDIKAIMEMGGEEAAEQWPIIQAILPAFNAGIDPKRPIRVDIIFGKVRDYRISIPYDNQKAILGNIQGFIGAKPRRIGTGLYSLKAPAFNGFLRDLTRIDYVIIAADRDNIPANFNPIPDIQPLLDAGYDAAASVRNTADGIEDRKKAIEDLRSELLGGLEKASDETDLEFKIRRVGLVHQLEELERLFADSESLVIGWTTDAAKKEARMDLELTALPDTDLAKSISELGKQPSLFSSAAKTEQSMFFGRVNHSLDEMRQGHLKEMLDLLTEQTTAETKASTTIADDKKSATEDATTAFFEMLQAGSKMGVFDGFMNVEYSDEGRSIVGTIRAADGRKIDGVLASLKEAGWDIELATAAGSAPEEKADEAPAEKTEDKPAAEDAKDDAADENDTEEASAEAKPEDAPTEAAEKSDAPAPASLAIHRVKVPKVGQSDFQNLFGEDVTLLVAGTDNGVYYAAGPGAEELLRKAVAETGEDQSKNDGTFIETWTKLGPWLNYLKERRERREAGQDLSTLTKEEKKSREERAKIRDMAIAAFSEGLDTIHMQLKSDQKKVTGMTTFAEGILRFVGRATADFAATTLQ